MKQVRRCVSILLACMFLLTSTAFASEKASDQIASYAVYVTPIGNGQISIDFTIRSIFNMAEIGAKEIYVFEKSGAALIQKAHYTKDDPDMSTTDMFYKVGTVVFDGVKGKDYYVTVTVFATDYNGGSDSRTKTYTVTAT